MDRIINSLLDLDLYKLTQQQAITKLYPWVRARYGFFNRGQTPFPTGFASSLREQVDAMATLKLLPEEKEFLHQRCGEFLDPVYLDLLEGYRYDPREVHISQSDDHLSIIIEGNWYRTILWEVPLMAIVCELYFKLAGQGIIMTEPNIASPGEMRDRAKNKAKRLAEVGAKFAEFGTRRRFSYRCHDLTMEGLIAGGGANLVGSSNVHFAQKYNIRPIGTQAHEWIMFHGAKYGYRMANKAAMNQWVRVYKGDLGTVLTDTYTTADFWRSFDRQSAKLFDGVRHDSGDPILFGEDTIKHYEKYRINSQSKTIIFSDGLDVNEAVRIQKHFNGRIGVSFGIGTHFTNDVGVKPLNIVIKMTEAMPFSFNEWIPTIKLSDVRGKHTGDKEEIASAIRELRLKVD
ncbi:MAG: nicotinate phosphoribosyltransferase [Candidatus Competibacteraceae bacterium]|nr:nicotinate phosphoribosyltransferase [Candidatus Competibacteraceae bacterium]